MHIYVAGPMRHHAEFNTPAFDAATAQLRALGHTVFSPAEHDRENGYDFTGCAGTQAELDAAGFDFRKMFTDDLGWICHVADIVVALPGWKESVGAKIEVSVAHAMNLPVVAISDVPVAEPDPEDARAVAEQVMGNGLYF